MNTVMDPVGVYVSEFLRDPSRKAVRQPAWLGHVREEAIEAFKARGFPTTRDEDWRFTSVVPIVETTFTPAAERGTAVERDVLEQLLLPETFAHIVFVNGRYVAEFSSIDSLPEGLRVTSLRSAVEQDGVDVRPHLGRVAAFQQQPFVALNTALWTDGALVVVQPQAIIDRPVHVLFVSAPGPGSSRGAWHQADGGGPTIAHPRVLVMAGPGSRVSIVETYVGAAHSRYFTNSVTEIVVAEQAVVDHYKVQRESDASYHVATTQAVSGKNATFNAYSIGFGGAIVRNDVVIRLAGEGGQSVLNGLYMADGTRLVDNHTAIDHATPHCDSREVYKGVLAGHARAVFNGKIIVRPDAQKTDAKQTNKALLLSEDAQINTKPQLEIFANDVKCTHGAAVGQMDEDALFYLRARGIPLDQARALLVQAFAGDVLNKVPFAPLRGRMEAELLAELGRWGGQP